MEGFELEEGGGEGKQGRREAKEGGREKRQGKGKGKVLGRSSNSSVSVIPTCPSKHPFRLTGSQTP